VKCYFNRRIEGDIDMKKIILALALTGFMGTAVMAESNETADDKNKRRGISKVNTLSKKTKFNKKKKQFVNKTTKKHKRSSHKFNA
jgi:hypothetical protein